MKHDTKSTLLAMSKQIMSDELKHCKKCDQRLPRSEFYKDSGKKDGLQSNCISCKRESKGIPQREKEREKQREKRHAQDKIRDTFRKHWSEIKAQWTAGEIYKQWAKARHVKQGLERDKANPDQKKARSKKWRDANKGKMKEARKRWELQNREYRLEYKRQNNKDRRERNRDNPLEVAKKRVRDRTRMAIKHRRWQKRSSTRSMLGCSSEMLVAHIEKQFLKGMNWGNRDRWHIDHIVPLASAKDIEELEALAHFSNLRPMWANENMAKGDKIVTCQPELALKH